MDSWCYFQVCVERSYVNNTFFFFFHLAIISHIMIEKVSEGISCM